jgi:hypothetical protein
MHLPLQFLHEWACFPLVMHCGMHNQGVFCTKPAKKVLLTLQNSCVAFFKATMVPIGVFYNESSKVGGWSHGFHCFGLGVLLVLAELVLDKHGRCAKTNQGELGCMWYYNDQNLDLV